MSWENDILQTVQDLIKRNKEVITYAGTVSSIDTTNTLVHVIVDGAQATIPCMPLKHLDVGTGDQVVVMKAGGTYYVVGIMSFKRVVTLPSYTGSHPINTLPGDMWYRSDLNQGFINLNGTPTSLT